MDIQIKKIAMDAAAALLPVVLSFLVALLHKYLTKLKMETHYRTIAHLTEITDMVVSSLYQSTIEQLKKEGQFNKQMANALKQKAIGEIKKAMETSGKKIFKDLLKDAGIDDLIANTIEKVIYDKKRGTGITLGKISTPISNKKIKGIEFNWKF